MGVSIFYKDWGSGQPIVFSHGWPLSSDDWDTQMMFFVSRGYRVIAHDRRGHGRSSQVADGHDMNHYADDLAALTEHLNLKDAVHIGHSTGGGEIARYIGRHGESRVAKAVLISAVPPLMLKTPANPGGLPKEVFDGFQAQVANARAQFYVDLPTGPFYGYNRPGAKKSQGVIENWWRQGMMGGVKAHYDGIVAFSQTDFTPDLKKFSVPTLVMHGDDDQIVPYADAGWLQKSEIHIAPYLIKARCAPILWIHSRTGCLLSPFAGERNDESCLLSATVAHGPMAARGRADFLPRVGRLTALRNQ